MPFCSIKDAYGEEWNSQPPINSAKNKEIYSFPPSNGYCDPYFNSNDFYGSLDNPINQRVEKIEKTLSQIAEGNMVESFTNVNKSANISLDKKKRLENILYSVLIIVFASQILEGLF